MRTVVVLDSQDTDRLASFWREPLDHRVAGSSDRYVVLCPRAGEGRDLILQRVPEPKAAKNRMRVGSSNGRPAPDVERLTELGATKQQSEVTEEAVCRWVVMADPEGNEFCVCTEPLAVRDCGADEA